MIFRQLHLGGFNLLCQFVGPLNFDIQLRAPLGDLRQLGLVSLCLIFHSDDLFCLLPLFVQLRMQGYALFGPFAELIAFRKQCLATFVGGNQLTLPVTQRGQGLRSLPRQLFATGRLMGCRNLDGEEILHRCTLGGDLIVTLGDFHPAAGDLLHDRIVGGLFCLGGSDQFVRGRDLLSAMRL